jgi:hypothetical protein
MKYVIKIVAPAVKLAKTYVPKEQLHLLKTNMDIEFPKLMKKNV